MSDLNSMTVAGSQFLLFANDINDRGEISGESFDPSTGDAPAFVGIPTLGGSGPTGQAIAHRIQMKAPPDEVRRRVQQRLGLFLMTDQN